MPASLLAIDLGASSGRAILGHLSGDKIVLEEVYRFQTPLLEENGRLYWNQEKLWEEIQQGYQKAKELAPKLKSISIDSWAVDYVPLDEEDLPLRNAYCYRDPIRNEFLEDAFQILDKQAIYQETGIQFLSFNTLYQHLADKKLERSIFTQMKSCLMIADYFNFKFSGTKAIEFSNASSTQMMSVGQPEWSKKIFDAFGFDQDVWGKIVPSGTILGDVLFDKGVKVIAGLSHDTGAAVAAVPAKDNAENWVYISCGTWSLLGIERTSPLLSEASREAGFTHEAGINQTIRYLKNLTGLWALQESMRIWQSEEPTLTYEVLLQEAKEAVPFYAKLNLEDARFFERGDMPEIIASFCNETKQNIPQTRGQMARVILESIASSYKATLEKLESLSSSTFSTIHMVGGGIQNELLCQFTANICQKKVIAGPVEATALGNLLVQAKALNLIKEDISIRDVVRNSVEIRTYFPE